MVAGVFNPEGDGAKRLANRCSKRLKITKMDVTKSEDVERVMGEIRSTGKPLWAVVNNAGIGFGAFFDWGNDIDLYKRLFDVNLFGVIRVAKAAVPLLRVSSGRIVNVASVAGRISAPTMAHYNMAKHSVRVFSDTIRREFSLTGDAIKVVTIEPTFYKTEIINEEAMKRTFETAFNESPAEIKEAYKAFPAAVWFAKAQRVIAKVARPNLNEVTDAMEGAVTLEEPKLFYRCGGYQDIAIWMVSHLPETIIDYFSNNWVAEKFLSLFVLISNYF